MRTTVESGVRCGRLRICPAGRVTHGVSESDCRLAWGVREEATQEGHAPGNGGTQTDDLVVVGMMGARATD